MEIKCLTQDFPQGKRVYDADGVAPSLMHTASTMRSQAILVRGFLPEMVVYSWMNSTGHRKNILNAEYSKIGVGCYYDESSKWGMNWVQIFTD